MTMCMTFIAISIAVADRYSYTTIQHKKTQVEQQVRLSTEAVEGTTRALERVDNIERGDSLALSVLSISDGVTNNLTAM